ncbi:transcription initiation factor TFIID subunit 10-like [Chironomus tepperi]|uniref:transcription initiation factor TFIID subunit 10-like n=1 Tax=Chironomus tepperi TaxID=113505 RepID=UPI00391EE833
MDNKNIDQKPTNFGINRPKETIQKNTLSEFLPQLENYQPTIPDAVTCYYMNGSGLNSSDPRIVRLISIAAQKFISDVANDALQYCKTKSSAAPATNKNQKDKDGKVIKDKKYVLTVDDLAPALNENYGIKVTQMKYLT